MQTQAQPASARSPDYREGAPTRVLGTERYRKPRLFVMTLGEFEVAIGGQL